LSLSEHDSPSSRPRTACPHPGARGDAIDRAQDAGLFERYNIVSDGDFRAAAEKLDQASGTTPLRRATAEGR
jgi:hypothetical protein